MKLETAPVVGKLAPLADGLDAPYWSGLAEGRLVIQRCPACSTWLWAPSWICRGCHHHGLDWHEVEPRGHVYSWTRTWQPFAAEFADHVPYVSVLVELADAPGCRLMGVLLGDDTVDPVIGVEVRGIIQPASKLTSQMPVLRWQRDEGSKS